MLLAWMACCAFVAGITPARGWAIGVGGGSIWIEHPIAGDDSAGQVFSRPESSPPRWWFTHEKATDWENWSAPLWPVVAVLLLAAHKARHVELGVPKCGRCGYDQTGLLKEVVCPDAGIAAVAGVCRPAPPATKRLND